MSEIKIKTVWRHWLKPDLEIAALTIFISLCVFRLWFQEQSIHSDIFNELIPGEATNNRVDVNARVSLFYKSVLLLAILFFSVQLILKFLLWVFKNKEAGDKKLFVLPALIGIVCVACSVFGLTVDFTIIFILIFLILIISFQPLLKKSLPDISLSLKIIWLISLSFSLAVFLLRVLHLFSTEQIPVHWLFALSWGIAAVIIFSLIKKSFSAQRILYASLPICVIGLWVVLSQELFLILNQHGIFLFSANVFFVSGSSLLIVLSVFIFYRKKNFSRSPASLIVKIIAPLTLASVIVIGNYNPVCTAYDDVFELANPANGLMRIFRFHEIPFFNFLNSHALSELFGPVIYSSLNGFHNTVEFTIYSFLPFIAEAILIYFFVLKIFRSVWIAFLFVLLFPFIQTDFMSRSVIFLGSVFLLQKLFSDFTLRRLVLLGYWVVFNLLWLIDTGVANLMAVAGMLLIYLLAHFSFDLLKKYFLAALWVAIPLIVFVVSLTLIFHFNTIESTRQAWLYISAGQGHGYATLTNAFDEHYYFQYYIIPCAFIFLIVFLSADFRRRLFRSDGFVYLTLLFLLLYYVANFQRGLVRHSLAVYDDVIASCAFLIIPLCIYYFIREKRKAFLVFFTVNVFLIFTLKTPLISKFSALYEKMSAHILKVEIVNSAKHRIERIRGHEKYLSENFLSLKNFLDTNLSSSQTFIDFSNTPVLYFYCNRSVPSFFCQYMQNTLTNELQKINIGQLKNYDAPIVVFCHNPLRWFDNTDDVPNTIRYALMCDYIFSNYKPLGLLNEFQVWKRNDFTLKQNTAMIDSAAIFANLNYNLQWYPMLIAKNKVKNISAAKIIAASSGANTLSLEPDMHLRGNFIEVNLWSENNIAEDLMIYLMEGEIVRGTFALKADSTSGASKKYLIPVSSQYNWTAFPITSVNLLVTDRMKIESIKLLDFKMENE